MSKDETLTEKLDNVIAGVETIYQKHANAGRIAACFSDFPVCDCGSLDVCKGICSELHGVLIILRTFRAEVEGSYNEVINKASKIKADAHCSLSEEENPMALKMIDDLCKLLRFFAGKGGCTSVNTAMEGEQVGRSKSVGDPATRNNEAAQSKAEKEKP